MRRYFCSCGNPIFFDSTHCVACGLNLGFDPQRLRMRTIRRISSDLWQDQDGDNYRTCRNGWEFDVCNWLIPQYDEHERCLSCRLNRAIPNLDKPDNKRRWRALEEAKRRLVFSLLSLQLPVISQWDDPRDGLLFDFLEDNPLPGEVAEGFVTTGHRGGVITINVAEADSAQRELIRTSLNEPYRTLLGHFRHESAHYFWPRLFQTPEQLSAFRALFGDETEEYSFALQNYYQSGPWLGWQDRYISAYASSHPFEDWAETWAHYLHIVDTLETAVSWEVIPIAHDNFDLCMSEWLALTVKLNQLNRSMGLPDAYPFVIPAAAREKLRFVADTIRAAGIPSPVQEAL